MYPILEMFKGVDKEPNHYIESLGKSIPAERPFDHEQQAIDGLLLGRSYMLIGSFVLAERMLERAMSYFKEHGMKPYLFFTHMNLGVLYREAAFYDKSLKAFNCAYDLSYEIDEFDYMVYALIHLGSIYCSMGNGEQSMAYLNEALNYVDKIPKGKITGDLFNNYAFALLDNKEYERALEYLYRAYDAYKTHFGNDVHINWIIVLGNIGETYYYLNDFEAAERYLLAANSMALEHSLYSVIADTSMVLSQLYEQKEQFKKALNYFKRYSEHKVVLENLKKQKKLEKLTTEIGEENQKNKEEIHKLRNVALKNKTNELERTLKSLSMITNIGQKLTASMDMDQIYLTLRASIYNLVEVHVFGLAVYDKPRKKIVYKYFEEMGLPLSEMEVSLDEGASLASYSVVNDEDVFITDFLNDMSLYMPQKTYVPLNTHNQKRMQSIIYCRLLTEEGCIGLITVQHEEKEAYTASDFEVIKALASYVAIAISNAQKKNIINEKAKELEFLSYRDPLTEVYNRRYFNLVTNAYDGLNHKRIGLIMGDMNHLKLINDHYGHAVGDIYLKAASDVLKRCARGHDVFRLGGDEFAILLHEASFSEVEQMMLDIRYACDEYVFEYVPLSISLGFEYFEGAQIDISQLFSKAESKMYLEKSVFHKKEM